MQNKFFNVIRPGIGKPYKHIEEVERGRNIFLFNVVEDPNEEKDVSNENRDVVVNLLTKLAKYNATAVPSIEIKRDYEGANPRNHGGALMPWRDVKQESTKKDEL